MTNKNSKKKVLRINKLILLEITWYDFESRVMLNKTLKGNKMIGEQLYLTVPLPDFLTSNREYKPRHNSFRKK